MDIDPIPCWRFLGRWWQKASKNIRAFPPAPRRTRDGDNFCPHLSLIHSDDVEAELLRIPTHAFVGVTHPASRLGTCKRASKRLQRGKVNADSMPTRIVPNPRPTYPHIAPVGRGSRRRGERRFLPEGLEHGSRPPAPRRTRNGDTNPMVWGTPTPMSTDGGCRLRHQLACLSCSRPNGYGKAPAVWIEAGV